MNIIFFGTPDYVVPVLDTLHKTFRPKVGKSPIIAVVTQAPKPSGRNKILQYSAVDAWAHKKNIPILFDPEKVKDFDAQIGVLASYGAIIPKSVIDHFPYGIINIHPSLLPKYRGASPVQAAIAAGETQTGSTFMLLDEKLDHGSIVSQFKEEILPDDTAQTLRNRLFERSSDVLTGLIPAYLQGKTKPKAQDHNKAVITRQIKKEDAFIPPEFINASLHGLTFRPKGETFSDWKLPFIKDFEFKPAPEAVERFIRAMQPWPVAWTTINVGEGVTKRLIIHKSHLEPIIGHQTPTTKHNSPNTNHKLVLDEVQLEGKGIVTWQQFSEGYPEANF